MPELAAAFQSLPPEYQRIIQLAQEQHQITVTPLQTLAGGWSGALIYLVSVSPETGPVRHLILKLDRKSKTARGDEISRHVTAHGQSPAAFARAHLAELAYERVEAEGAIGIFYSIAGQSLQAFRPLSNYGRQQQLEAIFTATNHYVLDEWNAGLTFDQALHPQALLARWLGFRLDPASPTERFIRQTGRANPDRPGFLLQSSVFPNPLWYARHPEPWGSVRPLDALVGLQHGDLNTNNILAAFSADGQALTGYYLIDFALFKDQMPLLFDLRYLEMSYLCQAVTQSPWARVVDLLLQLAEPDGLDPRRVPIELAGVSAVLRAARGAFEQWVTQRHPSLQDDLWGQYWLAGAAAGMAYCHKAGQPDELRLAGLLYAAANLKRFAAVFGLALPTDVEALNTVVGPGAAGAPAARATASLPAPTNLPAAPTAFIGREAQLAALKDMLPRPEARLVTLTGPGGTGKTRLSLQAAQALLDANAFPDGVMFVSLADDTTPNRFVSRVAQALDVKEGGRPLLENVKDYLRDKRLLLLLDNFEQLVSAATLAAELLAAAPGLKLLVSSRIALNVQDEREFPVPPLALPDAAGDLQTAQLAENESVQLFVARARAAQPSFALTEANAAAVADICRRLDGLPLALELAAARVKLLPPAAILARLDDRLKLLTGGARDRPARHQTLRSTIDWSYGLLAAGEQRLYARLGVFVGGFTLEAAEAVCNLDGGLDILEGLTTLANNSLLRQAEAAGGGAAEGEARFGMLETIRAYALERLAESGELATLQERHARYFGAIILQHAGPGLYTAQALQWLNWLEREQDNGRATLRWSQTEPVDAAFAAGLVLALNWFWYRRGYFSEGRLWAERALALPALRAPGPPRALALTASGLMAVWQGEQEAGLALVQEALAFWRRLEDAQGMAFTQVATGVALINMGQDSAAQPLLLDGRDLFQELKIPFHHAVSLVHLGNASLGLGQVDQARAWLEQAEPEARAIGESWLLAFDLDNLGEVARTQGRYDQARAYYEECETLLRASGDKGDLARIIHTLGYIAQHEGDLVRAEAQFRESLVMFRRLGNRRGMAECMAGLAGLRARQGQAGWGAAMLSAAEACLHATGGAWWPADRVEVEANRQLLHEELDEPTFAAAWDKGRGMNLEQALRFADASLIAPA